MSFATATHDFRRAQATTSDRCQTMSVSRGRSPDVRRVRASGRLFPIR